MAIFPKKINRILLVFLSFIVALFLFEMVLRIVPENEFIRSFDTIENTWWQLSSELCWTKRPNYTGEIYGAQRSFDEDGYLKIDSYQVNKGKRPKIILIGESCVFGNGVRDQETFGEYLERMLINYDVINLAVPGYSTYHGIKILDKYARKLKPAIAIISFNFNDRRYVVDENQNDNAKYFKTVYFKAYVLPAVARVSYIVRYIYYFSRKGKDKPEVYATSIYPRVSKEKYKDNLIKMIEIAGQQNIKIMFLSLSDNPLMVQPINRGLELLKSGNIKNAIEELDVVANNRSVFSIIAKKYLVNILNEANRQKEASAAASITDPIISLHGGEPIFLDSEYSDVMRDVSNEYGIPFIDGGAALEKYPKYYIDFCHFNANGHLHIAELIVESFRDSGLHVDSK